IAAQVSLPLPGRGVGTEREDPRWVAGRIQQRTGRRLPVRVHVAEDELTKRQFGSMMCPRELPLSVLRPPDHRLPDPVVEAEVLACVRLAPRVQWRYHRHQSTGTCPGSLLGDFA